MHRYQHDLYFESAVMILALINVGKYLEARSKGKTSEAITKLMDLAPKTALLERDGREVEVPVEQVAVGDIVRVKPGSSIPVDGVILEGSTSVDEAAITGESIPVEKQPGDSVIAATINKAGFVRVKAAKVGDDTTFSPDYPPGGGRKLQQSPHREDRGPDRRGVRAGGYGDCPSDGHCLAGVGSGI